MNSDAIIYIPEGYDEAFKQACTFMDKKPKLIFKHNNEMVYYFDFILPNTLFKLGLRVGEYILINQDN